MSVLPGQVRSLNTDELECVCVHEGCRQPAAKKLVGEVDSMGVEWIYFCQEHIGIAQEEANKPVIGCCDWCHAVDVEIKATRDIDEGNNGPVYDVCVECIKKQNALAAKEFAEMQDFADEDDSELYYDDDAMRELANYDE